MADSQRSTHSEVSDLRPFLFEGEIMVRVIEKENQPWFVAADVCRALDNGNPTKAVEGLDEDEVALNLIQGNGGLREVNVVSESGLYALIFKSRKPQAKRLRKWVTAEVLPSIRRTGRYETDVTAAAVHIEEHGDIEESDSLKLRKVGMAARCFGEKAGAQLWLKLGLEWVPAMAATVSQGELWATDGRPGFGEAH